MEGRSTDNAEKVYAAVNNIPSFCRSADLRRFFSQFIETSGFDCFHFRHRPEHQSIRTTVDSSSSESCQGASSSQGSRRGNAASSAKTFCCIIRVTDVKFKELVRTYHQRQWQDNKGEPLAAKCLISR